MAYITNSCEEIDLQKIVDDIFTFDFANRDNIMIENVAVDLIDNHNDASCNGNDSTSTTNQMKNIEANKSLESSSYIVDDAVQDFLVGDSIKPVFRRYN